MFVISRRNITIISVFIVIILAFVFCFSSLGNRTSSSLAYNKLTVVIDAGHGGVDGGVSGVNTKTKESDLNLAISFKLKDLFTDAGINVVMTRSSDAGLYGLATSNLKKKDMSKRKEIIQKANPSVVLSIHMNNFSLPSRRGAQVFFKGGDPSGKMLAESIQNSFNDMEKCVKKSEALKGDYYILNCTEFPSVICECGFLSNPDDEKLLINEEYQKEVAYAIFKGTINYFSLNKI